MNAYKRIINAHVKGKRTREPGWTTVARLCSYPLGNREVLACGHLGRYFGSNYGDLMEIDGTQLRGARRRCKRCRGAWEQLELDFGTYHHANHHAYVS